MLVTNNPILVPRVDGIVPDILQHLTRMFDVMSQHIASLTFLIHLNIAKQCHYIASSERLHVSRWLSQLRQEHGDDDAWTRTSHSLATDVMLLWNVFRYPCLILLEIGYTSASRSGGLKDIVQACEELLEEEQPLPESIRLAQLDMFK